MFARSQEMKSQKCSEYKVPIVNRLKSWHIYISDVNVLLFDLSLVVTTKDQNLTKKIINNVRAPRNCSYFSIFLLSFFFHEQPVRQSGVGMRWGQMSAPACHMNQFGIVIVHSLTHPSIVQEQPRTGNFVYVCVRAINWLSSPLGSVFKSWMTKLQKHEEQRLRRFCYCASS